MSSLAEMLTEAPPGLLEPMGEALPMEREVTGVTADSREVTPGGIFVAIPGARYDGWDFIPQAVERGAAAVVSRRPPPEPRIPWIRTADPREALAYLADAYWGHPSRRMVLVGITGTNGKTTICWLLREAWKRLGHPAASLGTLGVRWGRLGEGDRSEPWQGWTTPEAPQFQGALARLLEQGIRHAACEVSSHALVQHRVRGTLFRVVAFTNLGRDHLDFHGTMEAYREAKRRLFRPEGRGCLAEERPPAVVCNLSDPEGRAILEGLCGEAPLPLPDGLGWRGPGGERVLPFAAETLPSREGPEPHAEAEAARPGVLVGRVLESGREGLALEVRWGDRLQRLRSPLVGRFQAAHLLAAFGILLVLGEDPSRAAEALAQAPRVPGRMEPVGEDPERLVFVDYAHTPEALETILREGRFLTEGRVLLVFGCGGDRDRGKRPLMGLVAGQLADEVVVTTDNPRHEGPQAIIEDILEGLRTTSCRFHVVPDRREALARALELLQPGDVLLVAGRGAEKVQDWGERKVPFDDREVLRELLAGGGG
jgi:UDP-N-acetylmuramoyl-L-alanyl-D-glutamate--2,6-diaminopimelate ligase